MYSRVFNYTGSIQLYTVPNGVYKLDIKVWGGGGGPQAGGFASVSGAGGYSYGEIYVTPGQVLEVMVGQGGRFNSGVQTYGGGGGGGVSGVWPGGSGGGRSGVAFAGQNQFIIAGGGGGSGAGAAAGPLTAGNGGGLSGNNEYIGPAAVGYANLTPAQGGSQLAGGNGGKLSLSSTYNGATGSALLGGTGGIDGGSGAGAGGGGGYFGGGGGLGSSPWSEEHGGGGGSGFLDTTLLYNSYSLASTQTTVVQQVLPPHSTDPDYTTGIGIGVIAGAAGGNGLVVFNYTDPLALTKSVDQLYAAVGTTLTYTIAVQNTSAVTLSNVQFMDTIPLGTSFVPNSLTINATATNANPTPPGFNLGTMPINAIDTITFQVVVNSTIPRTVHNIAQGSVVGLTLPLSSNSTTTTISSAVLLSSKSGKAYANTGDILTYTIPLHNIGNVTAINMTFIDTLPNGTTLVPGSLRQDSTPISGTPNFPGVTLPNTIGPGAHSTITFQVTVLTLPTPNPMPNSAALTFKYVVNSTTVPNILGTGTTITNTVYTLINHADLGLITKFVDKQYSKYGDFLTYTFSIPNIGTTTAFNVVLVDTLSPGAVYVPGSLQVDGTSVAGNPSNITIGTIPAGSTSVVTFKVQITC